MENTQTTQAARWVQFRILRQMENTQTTQAARWIQFRLSRRCGHPVDPNLLFLVVLLPLIKVLKLVEAANNQQQHQALFIARPRTNTNISHKRIVTRPSSRLVAISMSRPNNNEKVRGLDIQPPRPNDSTYWVTDRLIAGEYPGHATSVESTREKIGQYLDRGISFFVDLTQEGEKMNYEDILRQEAVARGMSEERVAYRRMPIRDFGIPSKEQMKTILDVIDKAIDEKDHTVYVHCRGGVGRTGTTVGCYLVRNGSTGDEALKEVNRLFQNSDRSYESYCSPETPDQMDFVRKWEG